MIYLLLLAVCCRVGRSSLFLCCPITVHGEETAGFKIHSSLWLMGLIKRIFCSMRNNSVWVHSREEILEVWYYSTDRMHRDSSRIAFCLMPIISPFTERWVEAVVIWQCLQHSRPGFTEPRQTNRALDAESGTNPAISVKCMLFNLKTQHLPTMFTCCCLQNFENIHRYVLKSNFQKWCFAERLH
jgi:hypothetical protein